LSVAERKSKQKFNRRATEFNMTLENRLPDLNSVTLDVACEQMILFTTFIVYIKLNSMIRSSERIVFCSFCCLAVSLKSRNSEQGVTR
jgi:hypothetical protein